MQRICFVGIDNYPILNPAYGEDYVGGESVQQTLLAKAFVDKGYDVSMVVRDHGQPDGEVVDGIKVWKTFRLDAGLPVVRFIYPKLTSLIQALKKADADIYYQSCASMQTGIVGWFCKKYNKKFIFRIAHDTDCIPGQQLIPNSRDRYIYSRGLISANLVVAQSNNQMQMLIKNYGIQSHVIDMAVEIPVKSSSVRDIDVLWVNNIRDFKRPERCIEIAASLPQFRFVMIGGPVIGYESLYDDMKDKAREIANLDMLGFVPYKEVNDYYARTRVFINTSDVEGFPNSFLQSWVRGTPVVSFFDPDNIIKNEWLGLVPENLDDMTTDLASLLDNSTLLKKLSTNVRDYSLKRYSPGNIVSQYIDLINSHLYT